MSRLSGQVYDQTKSGGLVGDPSGPWVWSGLVWSGGVRVVECGHCATDKSNDVTAAAAKDASKQASDQLDDSVV